MRVPSVEPRRRSFGLRGWLIAAAVVLVVLLLSVRGLARFYTDYLWFDDVGFETPWRQLLSAKLVPALIFSAVFFALMLVNLVVADRVAPDVRSVGPEDEAIDRYRHLAAPYAGRIRVGVALFFAVIMGSGVSGEWQKWVLFANATDFGVKDPQFGKDVGFFVFRLPFLQFAASWTFAALLVVLVVVTLFHYLNGGIRLQGAGRRVTPQVKVHISVLLALMSLTKTFQYYLAQFSLTASKRGFVDGATYTDVNAQLPAYRLLMFISVAAAALFIVNIWRRGWIFPIIAVGLWGFISIVVGSVYPAVIQKFTVEPNELAREQTFIERNIQSTRAAFGLDQVETRDFTYTPKLDEAAVRQSQESIDNVRLYDPQPAQVAFKVEQSLLPFYEFADVDVDRYNVGRDKAAPVLAATRELDQGALPDKSWTSRHLVYTHGSGVVAAAADAVGGEVGDRPDYILQGIPPTGDIQVNPETAGIYFGEDQTSYVVVNSKVSEQEVAGKDATKQTTYTGDAGVEVSNPARRAALALRFSDWNFFVSGQVTAKSRVQYIRDVRERVQEVAPFLRYDRDPYPVVVDGRIIWMIDAYTITNSYPYSQSIRPQAVRGSGLDTEFNYVRNSVKATVDAYDGTVRYYVVDPSDPILRTYRKAFPKLFSDVADMPAGLRSHWRYPEDMFKAQTEQYALYHITDPVEFFNKQTIWEVTPNPNAATQAATSPTAAAPQQPTGNNGGRTNTLSSGATPMEPLYLTMQLPGEQQQEFALQRSFVPRRKAGILRSFIYGRSDGDAYGKLVVYNVGDPNAPSPAQAATAIESDQFISSQFSLVDQRGSTVERGDVQLIPVGDAVMYVRPIWITGEGSSTFPRFRFVAAVSGDRAVLGNDVNDAVQALLTGQPTQYQRRAVGGGTNPLEPNPNVDGGTTTTTTTPTTPAPPPAEGSAADLLAQAQREFDAANKALAAGNLGEYQARIAAAQQAVKAAADKVAAGG